MDDGLRKLLASAVPFALPLHRTFRGVTVREGLLIPGPRGWGEFAPFDDYSDAAASRWLSTAIEAAYAGWPAAARDVIPVNAILPPADAAESYELARQAVQVNGCTVIKMQVGARSLAYDVARVSAVRELLDSAVGVGVGRIRLDAKAAWNAHQALDAMSALAGFGIEYVEQPCASADELRDIRGRVEVAVAVDETIRLAQDPRGIPVRELADIAILKPAPLGGVRSTLELAERLEVPVVVSGSLDSSVGLAVALRAAACLPVLPYASGVGTGLLLADDLVRPSLVPQAGAMQVVAPEPDGDLLHAARERMGESRREYWRDRLARAWHACAATDRERVTS